MRDKEVLDLANAYMQICEQRIGVPLEKPTDTAAKKQLEKMIPSGEKVHLFKSQLQKANYEPDGEMVEELDLYDQVLEYLLSEGYSEEESKQIMVSLVSENSLGDFLKGVQKRTGIGKPGVGPGQVAKNIVRAGINDVLGTAIGTGSAPGATTPAKAPVAKVQTPAPIVKASTKAPRTAPKGANISPDPWKGGTTGNRIKDITQKPSVKPNQTRALTGSSGSNTRGLLPSSTSSSRGGAITPAAKPGSITPAAKPGSITPAAKPGSITPAAKPISGKPTSTRIQPVSVREVPNPSKSLGGTNVRGLLPQGARNILPDPWKQASDTVSGARNLWSRVQQATKPQSQLKPAQTNVRGMLPAAKPEAKPTPTTQTAKPATSTRSQQFRDVQRLNKMTGGGLIGELPSPKPADKLPPKPTQQVKPSVKPQKTPTSNVGRQGSSLPGIGGRLGAFGAGIQAYNTADATLKAAPKLKTTAKEVKKGETYLDPSTRVGSSQRFAQRMKVGPKIVGSGKVGTEAQSFDKAYGAAKAKGGMGSTFSWKGKSYKVS